MVDDESLQTMADLWDLLTTKQRWKLVSAGVAGAIALATAVACLTYWLGSRLGESRLERQAAQYERQLGELQRPVVEARASVPVATTSEVEVPKIADLSDAPSLSLSLEEFTEVWLASELEAAELAKPYRGKKVTWKGWVAERQSASDQVVLIMTAEKGEGIPSVKCYFDAKYKWSARGPLPGDAVIVEGVFGECSGEALYERYNRMLCEI